MSRRIPLIVVLGMLLVLTIGCTNKKSVNPLAGVGSKQPDKVLFDKAMAVAAGAEKHSDEPSAAPGSDADGIASIVDSVLADLRPKIFEEITRKMGKKK